MRKSAFNCSQKENLNEKKVEQTHPFNKSVNLILLSGNFLPLLCSSHDEAYVQIEADHKKKLTSQEKNLNREGKSDREDNSDRSDIFKTNNYPKPPPLSRKPSKDSLLRSRRKTRQNKNQSSLLFKSTDENHSSLQQDKSTEERLQENQLNFLSLITKKEEFLKTLDQINLAKNLVSKIKSQRSSCPNIHPLRFSEESEEFDKTRSHLNSLRRYSI